MKKILLATLVGATALGSVALGVSPAVAAADRPSAADSAPAGNPAARPAPADADSSAPATKPGPSGKAGKPVPGQFIVTVKQGNDPERVARSVDARSKHVFRNVLNGFAAELNEGQLRALKNRPDVEAVEQDQVVTADDVQYVDYWTRQPWGLDRADQTTGRNGNYYWYGYGAGRGVRAYVIDTGLQSNHPDFSGRVLNMYDAFGGSGNDCHGHGTHVAGTVAGETYGVAKDALIRGVRVLDCYGNGTTSGVIAGVDWVRANAIKPAVANMSLGGGYSSALNTAVYNLAQSGVFVAVAAGNEGQNACNVSPASAYGSYTTAATNLNDQRPWWSNFGGCVDGYAPGVDVKSAWIGSSTKVISGTSMASPHIAGTAALYKSDYGDAHWTTIHNWITSNSTAGVVGNNPSYTPNRLLNKKYL